MANIPPLSSQSAALNLSQKRTAPEGGAMQANPLRGRLTLGVSSSDDSDTSDAVIGFPLTQPDKAAANVDVQRRERLVPKADTPHPYPRTHSVSQFQLTQAPENDKSSSISAFVAAAASAAKAHDMIATRGEPKRANLLPFWADPHSQLFAAGRVQQPPIQGRACLAPAKSVSFLMPQPSARAAAAYSSAVSQPSQASMTSPAPALPLGRPLTLTQLQSDDVVSRPPREGRACPAPAGASLITPKE